MFPITFLECIAKHLDDPTLSALAQTCKKHMPLCYFRASRALQWRGCFGEPVSDPWLMYQIARIHMISNWTKTKEPGTHVKYSPMGRPVIQFRHIPMDVYTSSLFEKNYAWNTTTNNPWVLTFFKHVRAKLICAISCGNVSLYTNLQSTISHDDASRGYFLQFAIDCHTRNIGAFDILREMVYYHNITLGSHTSQTLILDIASVERDDTCLLRLDVFDFFKHFLEENERFLVNPSFVSAAFLSRLIKSKNNLIQMEIILDTYPDVAFQFQDACGHLFSRHVWEGSIPPAVEHVLCVSKHTKHWALPTTLQWAIDTGFKSLQSL